MFCLVLIILIRLIQFLYLLLLFFVVRYLFENKGHYGKLISVSVERYVIDRQTMKKKTKLKDPF